jgi:hypothetical protein
MLPTTVMGMGVKTPFIVVGVGTGVDSPTTMGATDDSGWRVETVCRTETEEGVASLHLVV